MYVSTSVYYDHPAENEALQIRIMTTANTVRADQYLSIYLGASFVSPLSFSKSMNCGRSEKQQRKCLLPSWTKFPLHVIKIW